MSIYFRNLFFALMIAAWGGGVTAQAGSGPARVPDVLRAGSELDYPPFCIVRPDGRPDGFAVDLLKAVAEAAGMQVAFSVGPWHEIKQQLAEGRLDVLPFVSYSEERDRVFDFSAPYLRMHGGIFVRKGDNRIKGKADLKGKFVIVMEGDTAHEYAVREHLRDHLVLVDSYKTAMQWLSEGRYDAVLVQQLVGLQLLKSLNIQNVAPVASSHPEISLKPTGGPLGGFEQKFCIAVPEGHAQRMARLNEGLAIVIATGTYDALYDKWFAPILPRPAVPVELIAKYVFSIVLPILLVAAIAGIWYLRRQVADRTRALHDKIDTLQKTEDALRQGEARYRSLFESLVDSAPEAIYVETDECFAYLNAAAARLFGASSPNQLLGTPVYARFQPDLREPEKNRGCWLVDLAESAPLRESVCLRLDGTEVPVEVTAVPTVFEGRNGAVVFARDISERKAAEAEREQLMAAIGQAFEMVVITDIDGIMQYVNPAFERITGYPADMAIGQNPKLLKSGRQDGAFYAGLWNTILSGKRWNGRIVNKRRDGTHYTAECSISPVRNASGEIDHFVWISRDITKELNLEKRIEQAQKMEAIGTLAGGIAHDFNNILFPILGLSEMMLEDFPPGSLEKENMAEICMAARRAGELVKQILSFSRQTEYKEVPVRLQQILKEVLKLTRSTIPVNIEIVQYLENDCGPVLADPTQLHQVAMNLITNAYHAVEANGGVISVELKSADLTRDDIANTSLAAGEYAMLTVSDTGCGIDPAVLPRIFEPYFTTKAQGKGTGLGLSMVYGIVRECGGDIRVYSEPGKGSTFVVYLPLIMDDVDVRDDIVSVHYPGGSERILLVDDEAPIVRLQKSMLERLGYRVEAHTDSLEALQVFKNRPDTFDLVITDMTMPGLTGDQLAIEMMRRRPDLPIIMCTGFSEKITERRADEIGIKGFLMKPVVKSDIANLIRVILDSPDKSP